MSVNVAVLCGRLTKDIEISTTQSGHMVARFTLAVQRDKENSDFINCVAWDKLAEIMNNYCRKGNLITLSGRIQTRNYENQQGQKVYVTEVIANNVQLPPKSDSNGQNQSNNTNTYQNNNSAKTPPKNVYTQMSLTQEAEKEALNDISYGDLPF